jgi:hypothetical protein
VFATPSICDAGKLLKKPTAALDEWVALFVVRAGYILFLASLPAPV